MDRPKFGQEYKGHFFLGGDPSKKSAWATREKFTELQEEFSPTKGMSGTEKFLAGVGSGMVDAGRNVTNMLLPDSMTPKWASDDAINEQRRLDQSLMDTGAGLAGNIVGGAAATAPVGGAALKGVQLAGRGVQAARGGGRLARTLGARATGRAAQVSAQGAAEGAILGGPDARGTGAAIGAVSGAAIHGAGRGVRGLNKWRASDKAANRNASVEARRLMGEVTVDPRSPSGALQPALGDIGQIPASHSLPENSLMRQIYSNVVYNMPGSTKPMSAQMKGVQHMAREEIIGEAIPSGVPRGTIITVGDNVQGTIGRLNDAWDVAFEPVERGAYRISRRFNINDDAAELLADEFGHLAKIPMPGDIVDGKTLLGLRMGISKLIYGKGNVKPRIRHELEGAMREVDKVIKDNLDPNDLVAKGKKRLPQGPAKFKEYQENLKAWGHYQTIMESAKNAKLSEFSFEDLAKIAKRKAGKKGLAGQGGFFQEIGEAGSKALGKFPNNPNPYQTLAAYALGSMALGGLSGGVLGGGQGAAMGALATPFAILGGARFLAKPSVQQRFLGRAKVGSRKAKALEKTLDKYRRPLSQGGFATRQLGSAAAEEQFNAP